ncbi:hypothetical protein ARC20_07630 [Stenotrophomonas panacihumi]|uniref:Uncharacterized protein n=1 Tax=Stenotrophomonas panacihumi TaxID=676599 RepID=A0A0R0ALA9_9GAMM|nr:hypothetical protein ARC20_07630 [Stenotrophomonas panacihumi]
MLGYVSEILTSKVPVAILVTIAVCRIAYVGFGTDYSLRMVKDIHACDGSELSGRLDEDEIMKMVKKCNAILGAHSKPPSAG